ncbi:MAG: glycosyltransferase family 4 protein [Verrucomicrobiota bacterium]|nr:glycosyltransferase family 4 protein [Verrucomicrobiota bacterium]
MNKPCLERILLTADTVGGVWTYAIELARALSRHGIQTVLATMGRKASPDQILQAAHVPGLELCQSEFKLEWMEAPWQDVEMSGDWLLELESDWKPDLIHLNTYAHGSLGWNAPVLMTAHSCVLSWWRAVKGRAAGPEWEEYQLKVTAGLRAADWVVCPSQAYLRELESHYGKLPKTSVILNGRGFDQFVTGRKENIVLSAGRVWDEAKNIRALTEVAGELSWPVCVAGDAISPDGHLFKNSGGNIQLLGRLSSGEMADWFSHAAIYALPAKYEPFGLSILEAALSGCALVLGDIPSLRELWDNSAIFVPPDDRIALKEALTQLILNPAKRIEFATRARQRAGTFSIDKMVLSYIEAYKSLVSTPQPQEVLCES